MSIGGGRNCAIILEVKMSVFPFAAQYTVVGWENLRSSFTAVCMPAGEW